MGVEMPKSTEWLFDTIWKLSDFSLDAGLPELSGKLEEAMDVYLAEQQKGPVRPDKGTDTLLGRRLDPQERAMARLRSRQRRKSIRLNAEQSQRLT